MRAPIVIESWCMPTDDRRLEPGTTVLGDVRIDSFVCARGLGALYLGTQAASGARLWVRVMSGHGLARAADLFAREVSVARHLEHSGSLAPLDAGVSSATGQTEAVVVYEPCEGISLQALASEGRLPTSEVARIATELASILDHAHRQPAPLVHGALSTASVILGGKSRDTRLLDLGIMQAFDRAAVFDEAKWELLDPSAFAPEHASRAFPIGPATDVFGLASIVFECLTGHVAFPATNPAEAEALVIGARPSAHQLRRELPPTLDRLLARAWSVDPRSRPNDIAAFARAIASELTPPDDDEATVNIAPESKAPPPKAPRAKTLPFGMPALAPSDPPIGDKPTLSKLEVARAAEKEPVPVPVPGPALDPPPTLRVVNVTAMLASLLLAGAIVIAGAMVAASRYVAPPAPTPPAPVVITTVVAAPSVSAPPIVSVTATASAPPALSAAPSAAPLWPPMAKEPGPRPSAKSIETLQARLKTAIEPCLKITPRPPPGMPWMIHFELDGPTGSPALVEVSRPYKGTVAGACITRAALDARVPPFDAGRWATDLRFAP